MLSPTVALLKVCRPNKQKIHPTPSCSFQVTPNYDSLLAKLMAHAPDRPTALAKLRKALTQTRLLGIPTNVEFLTAVTADPAVQAGNVTTKWLDGFTYVPRLAAVLAGGT